MDNNEDVTTSIDTGVVETVSVAKKRKKIWQVESGYHCSVIGTCLSRKDLRQIVSKKSFGFEPGVDDFYVHRNLSTVAGHRLPETRALHKVIDQKYRGAIKRYANLTTDDEISSQWKEDLVSGGVAGAYWAILTHPVCSKNLVDRVYGDCHMVCYDIFSSFSSDARKLKDLRKKFDNLRITMEKNRCSFIQEKEKVRCELKQFQLDKTELSRQCRINQQLMQRNEELTALLKTEKEKAQEDLLYSQVESLTLENSELREDLTRLTRDAQCNSELLDVSELLVEEFQENVLGLEIEKQELQEEILSLEEMFRHGMGLQPECDDCEEKLLSGCNGVGLSGKTILYVGGRNNMISHYREMVEKYGGVFLHHDGGKENSRSLLPRMLSGADAVLCPIDCVSHDACKCVKKICKRSSKPYVMMRSSGLSSLARGLGTIVQ